MRTKPLLLGLLISLLFSACSLVKNPSSSHNFKRVKYRANLNLPKAEKQPTVTAFEREFESKEASKEKAQSYMASMYSRAFVQPKALTQTVERTPVLAASMQFQPTYNDQKQAVLAKANELSQAIEEVTYTYSSEHWWEDDPEDWPWKEIVLALILFLLIVTAIYLMISLLGGVVGSLLGLVLLLLLIYLLLDHWQ